MGNGQVVDGGPESFRRFRSARNRSRELKNSAGGGWSRVNHREIPGGSFERGKPPSPGRGRWTRGGREGVSGGDRERGRRHVARDGVRGYRMMVGIKLLTCARNE